MKSEININTDILLWAIERAGLSPVEFFIKFPNVQKWINKKKTPTIKQLENFSKKVHVPFGYLFLDNLPEEKLPIPFFRSGNQGPRTVSLNVFDTVLLLQQRQDWLRNYLSDNEFEPLSFVGKFKNVNNVHEIVSDIRTTMGLEENWASCFRYYEEALIFLTQKIEDIGIITVFNGVFDNNVYRKISVDDCRGFVLVDSMVPFMFVNNADWKSAQFFTLAHELAHIWTGQSAGFDFREMQPANVPGELLCDKIAAELLVPENLFNKIWLEKSEFEYLAKYFKVSRLVIARRALDTGKINKTQFFEFYNSYSVKKIEEKATKKPGGDFYKTTRKRLSITFSAHIINAVKSGDLLYRDAYRLTGLKGNTFHEFFSKYFATV